MINTVAQNTYLQALLTLLAALLFAALFDWLVLRRLVALARRSGFELDDRLLPLLRQPIAVSIVFAGCSLALRVAGLGETVGYISQALVATLVILVWLFFAVRASTVLLKWAVQFENRFSLVQPTSLPALDMGMKLILFGVAGYLVLAAWRIDPTAWLASAGIMGIALGFAAKDTLANLFAGLFIIADAPYKVGDFIVMDTNRGQVTKIGLRSTRILTRDDIEITIPNATIANSKIINESGGPSVQYRLRIPVGIAYDSDIDLARSVLQEVAEACPYVSQDPAPRVRFRAFGDSSLNFELLCWIENPVRRGAAQDALNTAIFKSFKRAGIEIPFPKRDLYIKEVPRRKPVNPAPADPNKEE